MNKKVTIGFLIFGIVSIVFNAIILFFFGWQALWKIIQVVGIIILVAGFIALAVYLMWYFFIKKHKFDVTAVNRKKIIMAGKMQCPATIYNRTLRLSGDRGHSWLNFGLIKGYCRIQILTRETILDNDNEVVFEIDDAGKKIPKYKLSTEEQDIFITQRGMFPMTLFGDVEVVRVHPLDHDEMIGDVTLFGLNLMPISDYWFLASEYLNVRKIDRAILLEAHRGILFEMLKDVKQVIDSAIDLDSRHRKGIQEKVMFEIPQLQALQGGTK